MQRLNPGGNFKNATHERCKRKRERSEVPSTPLLTDPRKSGMGRSGKPRKGVDKVPLPGRHNGLKEETIFLQEGKKEWKVL